MWMGVESFVAYILRQHNVTKGDLQITEDCGIDELEREMNRIWASDFMWNKVVS